VRAGEAGVRALALSLVLAGCLAPAEREVTPQQLRAAVLGLDPAGLTGERLAGLERGEVRAGAPELDVYLARGRPIVWWNTGEACRVLVHASLKDPTHADTAVTTCRSRVAQVLPIEPALPCWRLAEVAPRVAAEARYFDARPIETQWQIVAGILRRGQSARDVAIAFGAPYNRGVDEREDGVRADQQVFLDSSGDAYGLRVTFIDDRVAGWKIPPERTLTPEAEQRRLTAMEQRLMTKLKELEQRSLRQHAETVALFGKVMDKQEAMLATLARTPPGEAAPPVPEPVPAKPVETVRADRKPPPPPPPGGVKVVVEKKQVPWGKSCREGSDDCAPGTCLRLTEKGAPTCTRLCTSGSRTCTDGYRCGFEKHVAPNGHLLERGLEACRPIR
jgi:hypothetical protein